jgi:hypothetical protein
MNKYNKYKHIIMLFSILGINFACQKSVTDIPPQDRIISELAFSTPEKIEKAVIGVYEALQQNNGANSHFLSARALIYADILGEDIIDKGNRFTDLPKYNLLSNSDIAYRVWFAGYQAIATANRVMQGVQANQSKITPALVKSYISEAKFGRAVAHFYLVNFFAQPYGTNGSSIGIPIITQAFTDNNPAANQPRSTVNLVYNQIIQDLTEALVDLPVTYADVYNSKTRATRAAVAAFLSRVYLYKKDYANAKLYAEKVIAGNYGTYALNASPDGCFGPGKYQTNETIFSIPNSNLDNPNTNNALPQHYSEASVLNGNLAISPTFLNIATNKYFAIDDKRRTLLMVNGVKAGNLANKFTKKYPDVTDRADWAPIIRYAEVLLNNAEASANISGGVDATAVDMLNLVRDRSRVTASRYTVASFANKTELIDAILGERRIELAFEGHRIFDLRRNDTPVANKLDGDGVTVIPTPTDNSKYILPIPAEEVKKSGGILIQNLGY